MDPIYLTIKWMESRLSMKLDRKQCPKDLLEIKKKKSVFSVVYKETNFMVIHYSKIYVVG